MTALSCLGLCKHGNPVATFSQSPPFHLEIKHALLQLKKWFLADKTEPEQAELS